MYIYVYITYILIIYICIPPNLHQPGRFNFVFHLAMFSLFGLQITTLLTNTISHQQNVISNRVVDTQFICWWMTLRHQIETFYASLALCDGLFRAWGCWHAIYMLMNDLASSNKNIFYITGPLWWESTGDRWIPLTKVSNAERWCILVCAPEQTSEQRDEMLVIWDPKALIMTPP